MSRGLRQHGARSPPRSRRRASLSPATTRGARQRHVLPGLRLVAPGRGAKARELGRQRPLAAGGPQPHVDLVELAGRGRRGQRGEQALGAAARNRAPAGSGRAPSDFAGVVGKVVDHDQVEVGGGGHLARAELAHRQHRDAAAAHLAVVAREGGGDPLQQRARAAPARARYRPGRRVRDRARRTAAGRRSGTSPRRRSRGRGRARPRRSSPARGRRRRAPPSRASSRLSPIAAMRPGSIAASSTCGRLRDDLGEPRRAAEEVAEQLAHRRVGAQDRQQLDRRRACARAPRRRRRAPRRDRRSRRRRRAAPASARSAPRARGRCAPPRGGRNASRGSSRRRSPGRWKPSRAQGRQRLGIVDDAGEDEAAARRRRASARPRTAARNGARPASDGRSARWRSVRAARSRRIWRSARVGAVSNGSRWVCSSATICRRCSSRRRKT